MTIRTLLLAGAATALALPATAQTLTVFDYSGFEDPAFHQSYAAEHGESPAFAFFGDEEEAFQKLASGFNEPGTTHICAGSVPKFTESGLIEPWDTDRIAAYGDLNSNLTGQDVAGGETYFIPTDFGSTAIAYNTEDVPAEDVASLQVFQNPAYAGRMTLPDNVDDAYALAYLATGVTDWTTATEEQFQAASEWLRAVHPNLRTYWTDPAELAQLMQSGEVQVAWAWNETYPTLVDEGFPVGFQREAAEGSSLWLCGYVNMADSTSDEDLTYDYINAILDPSATGPLMDGGWGHANQASMDANVSGEDMVAGGLGPIDAPVLAQLPMDGRLREMQAAEFEKIKAGF